MHIEIQLPRPGVLALAIVAISGWAMYLGSGEPAVQTATVIEAPAITQTAPVTPSPAAPSPLVGQVVVQSPIDERTRNDNVEGSRLTQAEMRVKWARAEQEFLRQKQDILREQLESLQKERDALGPVIDAVLEERFRRSVQMLTALVKDEKKAEQFLLMTYRQEWEAEERAMAAAQGEPSGSVSLFYPVEPTLGISAYFMDPAYKQRFKVDHYAIDIPVPQGTDVVAAQDGVVKDVVDHGLGYNYVTIDHGGYATVYGHISEFSVRPGQRVRAGDRVGKSGGTPGLSGGGKSTGPHLHFGLYINGIPVDPLLYLPKWNAQ